MGFGWHTFNTVFATALATGRAIPAFLVFLVLLEILRPWRWRLGFSANGWNRSPRLHCHCIRCKPLALSSPLCLDPLVDQCLQIRAVQHIFIGAKESSIRFVVELCFLNISVNHLHRHHGCWVGMFPGFLVFLALLEILRPRRWRLGFSASGWNLSPRLPNHGTRWHQVNSALSRAGTQIKPRANMLLSPSA